MSLKQSDRTISVVVPCFNVEPFVAEALDSLKNQSVQPNEVIIVDDGSADGTAQIVERYAGLSGWTIVRTSNQGLGPARNLGRALAKSEYVYFFDADDVLESDCIAHLARVLEEAGGPDLILFAGQSFYDEGFEHAFCPVYTRTLTGQFDRGGSIISELERRGELYSSPNLYLSKNTLWAQYRLTFPPVLHEDEAVLFPLLAVSEKTVVLSDVLFRRRIRAHSIMTTAVDARNASGIVRALHETLEFMSREPELVEPDIDAWRARLAHLAHRYVGLSRQVGAPISLATVIAAVIAARSVRCSLRMVFTVLPESLGLPLKRAFRRFIARQ